MQGSMSLTVRLSFGAWSELFSRRMGAFSERSAIPVLCLLYFPPNTLWIRNLLHTSGSRKFISHFCHNDHFLLERYGNHHKNIKSCIYRGYLCRLLTGYLYCVILQLDNCLTVLRMGGGNIRTREIIRSTMPIRIRGNSYLIITRGSAYVTGCAKVFWRREI